MANRRQMVRTRRPTFWVASNQAGFTTLAANTSAVVTMITEATLEETPNPTHVRCRGQLDVHASAGAAGDSVRWSAGLMYVDARAAAIGVTAIPRPISDGSSDGWLWIVTGFLNIGSLSSLEDSFGGTWDRIIVDSKAMRKVGKNEVLVVAYETSAAAGTGGAEFSLGIRVLFKR